MKIILLSPTAGFEDFSSTSSCRDNGTPSWKIQKKVLTIEVPTPFFSPSASWTVPSEIQRSDTNCQENQHPERADRHKCTVQVSLAGIWIYDNPSPKHFWSQQHAAWHQGFQVNREQDAWLKIVIFVSLHCVTTPGARYSVISTEGNAPSTEAAPSTSLGTERDAAQGTARAPGHD